MASLLSAARAYHHQANVHAQQAQPEKAITAMRKLLDEGLICRPIGNTLTFSPPLIVTKEDVDNILERFARGLNNAAAEMRRDGTWRGGP